MMLLILLFTDARLEFQLLSFPPSFPDNDKRFCKLDYICSILLHITAQTICVCFISIYMNLKLRHTAYIFHFKTYKIMASYMQFFYRQTKYFMYINKHERTTSFSCTNMYSYTVGSLPNCYNHYFFNMSLIIT
jgi:hypothetical protein